MVGTDSEVSPHREWPACFHQTREMEQKRGEVSSHRGWSACFHHTRETEQRWGEVSSHRGWSACFHHTRETERSFITQGVVCMLSSHWGGGAEMGRARQTQVNLRFLPVQCWALGEPFLPITTPPLRPTHVHTSPAAPACPHLFPTPCSLHQPASPPLALWTFDQTVHLTTILVFYYYCYYSVLALFSFFLAYAGLTEPLVCVL